MIKKSILNLFNECSYFIQSLDCVRTGIKESGIDINQKLYERAQKLVHDDAKDIFQYVVLAKRVQSPEEAIKKTDFYLNSSIKVLCILPITDSSLAEIRLIGPLRIWAEQYNGSLRIRQINEFRDLEDVIWADVVVFQREANIQILNLLGYFKKLQKRVVFDVDDLLSNVPVFLTMHKHSLRTKKYLQKALRMSDAVTVTNQRLKNELTHFNSNVIVIPNCSSAARHDGLKNRASEVINLVIASSDTVQVDFMIPVLKKLNQQTELNFHLIGIGPPGKFIAHAGIKIELHENMSYDNFKSFLSSLDNAIGLIPLDDSKFSSCKSAIKFADFSLSGVVAICSSVPPYSDTVINGETGILVPNDLDSWYEAIRMVGSSKELRSSLLKAARCYCLENFAPNKSAEKWQELFLSLKINNQKLSYDYLLRQKRIGRVKLIWSHILNRSSYFQGLRLIRQHGVVGFTHRVFGYLKLDKYS